MPGFVVPAADAGARLDVALAAHAGLSRSAAQRLIADGRVTVAGEAVGKHHQLHAGDTVHFELPEPGEQVLQAEDIPVPIVYEDEAILVVDKPAGLVVHPAAGHEHGTLVHALLARGVAGGHERRPGVVHRLDKDTSGLMVVARTDAAYQSLVALMSARHIHREYSALVCGGFPQKEGTIDAPIGRHVRDRKRMSVHTHEPRRAVTHFAVARRFADYTLLDVRLETGRTHQIRVHVAALGYPVAGDEVYGRRPRPEGLARQFLHARRLAFPHPLEAGRELTFASPLPPDLAGFLELLEAGRV
jgi:23S rRNA pseudouridine1911/1915/1917 synthase